MGGQPAKLHRQVEEQLTHSTHFQASELRKWYTKFNTEHPRGRIDKTEFVEENLRYTKFGDEKFWGHIFEMFDVDHNGEVSFVEWITALSTIIHGTLEERIRWLFQLYDMDGDGSLGRGELYQIVTFLSKVKPMEMKPDEVVEVAFMACDRDGDDSLSVTEFEAGIRAHPELLAALDVLRTIFGVPTGGPAPAPGAKATHGGGGGGGGSGGGMASWSEMDDDGVSLTVVDGGEMR